MLNEFPVGMRFILCLLALWRLTHLIVAEDGPWDMVVRLRARLGDTVVGRAMDCFYCSSLWFAIPFAIAITGGIPGRILAWLSLSGGASLLEQVTTRNVNQPLLPQRKDDNE